MAAPVSAVAAGSATVTYSPALRVQVCIVFLGSSRCVPGVFILPFSYYWCKAWIFDFEMPELCFPVTVGNGCSVVSGIGIFQFPQAKSKLSINSGAADSKVLSVTFFYQ